jgi:hypothetical protein
MCMAALEWLGSPAFNLQRCMTVACCFVAMLCLTRASSPCRYVAAIRMPPPPAAEGLQAPAQSPTQKESKQRRTEPACWC